MRLMFFMLAAFLCSLHPQAQTRIEEMTQQQPDPVVEIKTTLGDIKVRLYNDTPLHRDNFLKLVGEGFYDGVLFHRVIDGFMVQTGDPDSREAAKAPSSAAATPATPSRPRSTIRATIINMERSPLPAPATT